MAAFPLALLPPVIVLADLTPRVLMRALGADVLLWAFGATIAGMVLILLVLHRHHNWQIEDSGLRIVEGFGLSPRSTHLGWDRIARLARSSEGLWPMLDLTTTGGRRFVLPTPNSPVGTVRLVPDPARLEAFANRLRARAEAAGHPLPAVVDGPGPFDRAPGLVLGLGLLGAALALMGAAGWALATGRWAVSGETVVLGLLGPAMAAGFLVRFLTRALARRRVLAADANGGA
jgi:hypothetical protein